MDNGKLNYVLRIESMFIFVAAISLYYTQDYKWKTFAIFLLAPDLSMIGYLINKKIGAIIYNLGHTYATPALLLLYSYTCNQDLLYPYIIIWTTHIAMDRMIGFGLKSFKGFRYTHLGFVGKEKN